MFLLSSLTYFNKMLHISIHQSVNNLYYILKNFDDTQMFYLYINNKSIVDSLSMYYENKVSSD